MYGHCIAEAPSGGTQPEQQQYDGDDHETSPDTPLHGAPVQRHPRVAGPHDVSPGRRLHHSYRVKTRPARPESRAGHRSDACDAAASQRCDIDGGDGETSELDGAKEEEVREGGVAGQEARPLVTRIVCVARSTSRFTFRCRQRRSVGAFAGVACASRLATDRRTIGGSVDKPVAAVRRLEAAAVN